MSEYVSGICVPYGEVTYFAADARHGEVIKRGAFAEFLRTNSPNTVRLVDAHIDGRYGSKTGTARRPYGRATRLEERDEGLYGEFEFYDTPTGREGAEECRAGTYGGFSIGFIVQADYHDSAGLRVVTRATLQHVALVDSPAYAGAVIDEQPRQARPTNRHLELRSLVGLVTLT